MHNLAVGTPSEGTEDLKGMEQEMEQELERRKRQFEPSMYSEELNIFYGQLPCKHLDHSLLHTHTYTHLHTHTQTAG